MPLYKLTADDGAAYHGGRGRWKLPEPDGDGWTPGAWMPAIRGELVPCLRGYHLVRAGDILSWAGPKLWVAEHDGELVEHSDKVVVRRARLLRPVETWTPQVIAGLALDFAERSTMHAAEALPRWRDAYPDDDRPAKAIEAGNEAIEVARRFLRGEVDESAARAAESAESAARAAESAESAAWSARSARSARAAESAAWSAWSAAESAARAAWSAWSAAWSARSARAARAAESAAWSARSAESAARAAAESAAAEREWQTARIIAVLGLDGE